jgi:hypothetical protein
MRRVWKGTLASMALVAVVGCSASSVRKISHVEFRTPASARKEAAISANRAALGAFKEFAPACPGDLQSLLSSMATERVSIPLCPSALEADFYSLNLLFTEEERTALDEILNGQCRSRNHGSFRETLERVLNSLEAARDAAPQTKEERRPSSWTEHAADFERVRSELEEVRNLQLPLDLWTQRHGDFVITEEEVDFLHKLVVKDSCRMENQEIDQSYRTMQSLEELIQLEKENDPQRAQLEKFFNGVQKVIDRRIQEYFRP